MFSAGNGLTTPSPTRVSNSSLRNSVSAFYGNQWNLQSILGLPADIVPSTYKKKRTTAAADAPKVKGEEDDEKVTEGETSRPLGRGARWTESSLCSVKHDSTS